MNLQTLAFVLQVLVAAVLIASIYHHWQSEGASLVSAGLALSL